MLLWGLISGFAAIGSLNVLGALVLLTFYGLGARITLLVLADTSRYLSQSWRRILPHTEMLQRTGGILMTGTTITILLGWDVEIQLWRFSI